MDVVIKSFSNGWGFSAKRNSANLFDISVTKDGIETYKIENAVEETIKRVYDTLKIS